MGEIAEFWCDRFSRGSVHLPRLGRSDDRVNNALSNDALDSYRVATFKHPCCWMAASGLVCERYLRRRRRHYPPAVVAEIPLPHLRKSTVQQQRLRSRRLATMEGCGSESGSPPRPRRGRRAWKPQRTRAISSRARRCRLRCCSHHGHTPTRPRPYSPVSTRLSGCPHSSDAWRRRS